MSVLNELLKVEKFKSIWIDRNKLMDSLGINLDRREFLDLSSIGIDELYELMMKSLMWMEYISDVLSRAKKLKMDEELEKDAVLNRVLAMGTPDKKVTEAKAEAKSHPDYLEAHKRYNTLVAYVDYLDRLLVNLDKYHYVMKAKMESSRNIERKYQ
jgi:hypothetical protein